MSSTGKRTENLNLSQFVGTDKPNWLTDYNNDMEKIDSKVAEMDQGLPGKAISYRGELGSSPDGEFSLIGLMNAVKIGKVWSITISAKIAKNTVTASSFKYGISIEKLQAALNTKFALDPQQRGNLQVFSETGAYITSSLGFAGVVMFETHDGTFHFKPARVYTEAGGCGALPANNAVSKVGNQWVVNLYIAEA
ncbi:hypothetical protein LJC61_02550 [Ruminococcaceae bacterium OttesenSCG-928-A16]|nr:hypothetical protein [Ruminococcaceae bacterium OttesenSCG-928-A16]